MPAEKIHHLNDNERLILELNRLDADAIYALILWLDGWQEDRHQVPGAWELCMAYRSAKIRVK